MLSMIEKGASRQLPVTPVLTIKQYYKRLMGDFSHIIAKISLSIGELDNRKD